MGEGRQATMTGTADAFRLMLMSTSWYRQHPIARRVIWIAATLAGLCVILVLVLSFLSDAMWKRLLEKTLSGKTGRDVTIEGPVHVRLLRWHPDISVDGLRIPNAVWKPDVPMLSLKHFEATVTWSSILRFDPVFPRVLINAPQ